MPERDRKFARELARQSLEAGDPAGCFEKLYASASGDAGCVPWADLKDNPNLVDFLDEKGISGKGKTALKIGCGLGDDAEELASRGFTTTAFDISETAIRWCKSRFPDSPVRYVARDLFFAPESWNRSFDFIVESYTLQVLPPKIRSAAFGRIAGFTAKGGSLLVIARGRDESDDRGQIPWPLLKRELEAFETHGLTLASFEDYMDTLEDPNVRRFRALYDRSNR